VTPISIEQQPHKQRALSELYNFISQQFNSSSSVNSSLLSFQEQIAELQFIMIQVKQVLKIPRLPPAP
jgi:hypothetical protein